MINFHIYGDSKLRQIWLGYIEGPGWTVFIPANKGKPYIHYENS